MHVFGDKMTKTKENVITKDFADLIYGIDLLLLHESLHQNRKYTIYIQYSIFNIQYSIFNIQYAISIIDCKSTKVLTYSAMTKIASSLSIA